VVFVRQRATTTDGDQPRIALFREDRHAPIPTIHESACVGSHQPLGAGSRPTASADLHPGRIYPRTINE
jgi:hypothetical protein